MGRRYNFKEIADSQDFSLVPLGKYPARLKIDAFQHDQLGNLMTDGAGEPVPHLTTKGNELWKLQFEILNTTSAGRIVFDNLNFSNGGLKRVKVMFVRAGFPDDYEGEVDPDDLDGTYWNILVDSHEVAKNFKDDTLRESKYTFKNSGQCKCETCLRYDGQKVSVNPRIGFAGFELMDPKDAAMYKASTPHEDNAPVDAAACFPCSNGDHSHTVGKSCPCLNVTHPPF